MGDHEDTNLRMAESITKAGCGAGRAYLIAGEESGHRAYIGISDDGSIGEGTDGRSIYHTMAHSTE